ncbi:MAG: helix-turn-helix domain-containing protein [Clostridiales bacterium]|nr:helix-turn-helix domain-containing protein [Clostridiales bacterium]
MKTVPFELLNHTEFSIGKVFAVPQKPAYGFLRCYSRAVNGFLLIEAGSCAYEWEGGDAVLRPGDIIYLPAGSKHSMTVTAADTAWSRVDYVMTGADGEQIIHSRLPLVFPGPAERIVADSFHQLTALFFRSGETLRALILVCSILQELTRSWEKRPSSRITPALRYISEHYCEEVDFSRLADLCGLGSAQMYRLFRAETGTTPVAYRNALRITRACQLLSSAEFTVSEIADMLGFDSLSYFSRTFRKYTGLPPTEY